MYSHFMLPHLNHKRAHHEQVLASSLPQDIPQPWLLACLYFCEHVADRMHLHNPYFEPSRSSHSDFGQKHIRGQDPYLDQRASMGMDQT